MKIYQNSLIRENSEFVPTMAEKQLEFLPTGKNKKKNRN